MTKIVGTVVVGDGETYFSRLVSSESEAKRIQATWKAHSGGSYTAPLASVLDDGTLAGAGASAAKTFLQSQSIQQLKRARVDSRTAVRLRT